MARSEPARRRKKIDFQLKSSKKRIIFRPWPDRRRLGEEKKRFSFKIPFKINRLTSAAGSETAGKRKQIRFSIPVQAATGGRSGVSVYKAGRSVPLDSAQLDLSRLALPQLGSAGVEKCFEIHVPSSGLKTQKNRKTSKNAFHE